MDAQFYVTPGGTLLAAKIWVAKSCALAKNVQIVRAISDVGYSAMTWFIDLLHSIPWSCCGANTHAAPERLIFWPCQKMIDIVIRQTALFNALMA